MSLARPWWLAALTLLLPLLVLHLRRPTLAVREVSSLLVWERVGASPPVANRRLRRPRHPLLLLLQALALSALVVGLAGPELTRGAASPATVYVVDGSLWMHVGTRSADARREIVRDAALTPTGQIVVVSAGATPSVVYRGSASGLARALARLRAGSAAGDLAAGVTLAAGLLGGPHGRMVVLRAPESPLPPVLAAPGQLTARVVGSATADQGLFAPAARCGIGPASACEVVATVRNEDARRHVDRYTAFVDGRPAATLRVEVPARSTAEIAFTAPAGTTVRLRLTAHDPLPLDDTAWVEVPGPDGTPPSSTVTLVGDPTSALSLAQALASVPGVTLRLRTAATYRRRDALASDLVVLDGFMPASGLPPAPAVALVAPPRLPGGSISGAISAPTVSGQATASDLLDGVDLTSLSVDRGAAELLALPASLEPLVWSPSGPLLAGGDDGRRRVAVLAFDPVRSNLTQLPAFPILARNLVRWADGWATIDDRGSLAIDAVPGTTRVRVAGTSGPVRTADLSHGAAAFTGLAPSRYRVSASGAVVTHRRTLAASLELPTTVADATTLGPIDLASWAAAAPRRGRTTLTPWLLVLALIAMAGDWIYWRRLRA